MCSSRPGMSCSGNGSRAVLEGIHWLGHASFRIDGDQIIYIDPYRVRSGPVADIVLVSHAHYDHCSQTSIERISRMGTVVIAGPACAGTLRGEVRLLAPGESVTIGPTEVGAVPAYSTKRSSHPRSEGGVGFLIATGGRRIYFAGDTDLIPEMAKVSADVVLLPVSGIYVMSAEEAADAVSIICPAVAVPMHYGTIVGSRSDALRFKELSSAPVVLLEREA